MKSCSSWSITNAGETDRRDASVLSALPICLRTEMVAHVANVLMHALLSRT